MGNKRNRNKPKETPKEKPREKPIDRWLTLASLAVAIMLFLLPKTPAAVISALILIFILLVHPIWYFWWIEKKYWRRSGALFLLICILILVGFASWPKSIITEKYYNKVELEQPTFREKVDMVFFSLGERAISIGYKLDELKNTKVAPFNFDGYRPITLYVENNKLYADVKIYGGPGEPSIEIVHNEFIIRRPNWDKNSNQEALEIVDENHKPIFQMIYKHETELIINGIFPSPAGIMLAGEQFINNANPSTVREFSLKRIFKYPSSEYPGQLDDVVKPWQRE